MSGKAFLDPPGHLNVRNSICLHIHSNIQMELVFHTTSGASRSRLPSTYLNVVTVLQTTFLLDLLKYWYIYNIIIICYTVRQKFGKSFPTELNTINSQETFFFGPTNPVLGDVGRKKIVPVLGFQREFAELYNWFWWVKTSYCSQIWSKPCHPCRNLFLRTVGAILCCKVAQLLPSQQGVLLGVYTSWFDGDYQKIKIWYGNPYQPTRKG